MTNFLANSRLQENHRQGEVAMPATCAVFIRFMTRSPAAIHSPNVIPAI